ncbi:MAG: alpha/beta hydrolase [Flavobacteriales bacterium]|nr:alpha/beta hydrolase [Flavobacteriales bacterium]
MEIKKKGKFQYFESGSSGKPLVLLHGLFGALSNFEDIVSEFKASHRVIVPILPIYELPILKANLKELSKHISQFIEEMQLDNIHLLGNSLGGHIGLIYSVANQNKLSSLILTGSSGLYENAFGGSFPRREDKKYLKEKIALTFYDPGMVTDKLVDECHEAVNNRNKVIRILSIAKSAIRNNMAKDLPEIKTPTCLIWGKNDTVTPPDVAEEFNSLLPNSRLHWIDKCGHAPMMEHPERFNEILKEWLESFD